MNSLDYARTMADQLDIETADMPGDVARRHVADAVLALLRHYDDITDGAVVSPYLAVCAGIERLIVNGQ